MLTNPNAVDYGTVLASLSNPGQIQFDEIRSATPFFDIKSFNPNSVTFQAKSNIVVKGVQQTTIDFKFFKDQMEVSTSQLALSVGIPLHAPVNDAIGTLDVEADIEDEMVDKFYLEATNIFNNEQSTNVASGIQLGLSYKPFSLEVKSGLQATFAANQPNVTYAYGTTATAKITLYECGPVTIEASAEVSNLFPTTGKPVNMASISTALIYATPPDWGFKSIGLVGGVESYVGSQHALLYNPNAFLQIQIKAKP